MERVHRRTDIANTGGAQNRFIRMYLSDPSHSDPFLVLHSSILQPSSSLVALLAELLKLEPATTTPIYIYMYVYLAGVAEWVRGYTYRVAGGQKTIKSGYHPGRHFHHFTFLPLPSLFRLFHPPL